ncbi:MAG: hypothetical protein EAY72_11995 [Bacteroidetes bacterium]|nr:MAG: hypothetical protein EAY72_11995 [Bacteroidota bacterium]TAE68809.1 MAG: hypothetical protein EAY68_04275 [Bacteroidota bacterium]
MQLHHQVSFSSVTIQQQQFYKISNAHAMRPFFMSIVSSSNHWLFVASNGGLTAGRKNAEYALFPYYTDDKLIESAEHTGCKTILRVQQGASIYVWEPFSIRSAALYQCTTNIYKSEYGNSIIFEEVNHTLQISFQYQWSFSNTYGFVRTCTIHNLSDGITDIAVLDGFQNVLPYGVGADLQVKASNLADAYKRAELVPKSGLGIFALSAIIVDKAEPSEALKANTVWQIGLSNPTYLLSATQLHSFRNNGHLVQEEDVKGEKGAYFVVSEIQLQPAAQKQWMLVANVNLNHAAITHLAHTIVANDHLKEALQADIKAGTEQLIALTAAADATQATADALKNTRHYANVLFNIMRGGIFDNNYAIEKDDFLQYLKKANQAVYYSLQTQLQTLPAVFTVSDIQPMVQEINHPHFTRLATEYLPLKFSRRHGDPSRPWNQFSINTIDETTGAKLLDYQGNWRDIFQNWEALAHAYPAFIKGMIYKFLNASTFDGYNPYRVTKGGFDWETIEPDNPWSYIGYWGDHQIIYLLKFLEFSQKHFPSQLSDWLTTNTFVYANVPYNIKDYQAIVQNPKDTIVFNHQEDHSIQQRVQAIGADGALLTKSTGDIYTVNFTEKILATVLAKLTNYVHSGGIWMNTQRPEWNDANNALVGNGLSMVTLYYLRRFLQFMLPVFEANAATQILISAELLKLFTTVLNVFNTHSAALQTTVDNTTRKNITDALGMAASDYRTTIYSQSFSGNKKQITGATVVELFSVANKFLEYSITINKRKDNLFHTYNLLDINATKAQVNYLSEMLEGQVAVLSSGYLTPNESLEVLDSLKNSLLYRADQNSYILYPNKQLPGFLQKNTIPAELYLQSPLLQQLVKDDNKALIERAEDGKLHFNGNFRNAADVQHTLQALKEQYAPLVEEDGARVLSIFEAVFNHKEFTGRSGTFFAYEGLGSIYWHMVSKLALAVQETCLRAIQGNAHANIVRSLVQHYYAVTAGIGVHKSPEVYGGFPTDPYSHTPLHKGVQQPGMTGQVKEDIICRFGELGVLVNNGCIQFQPTILLKSEFLVEPTTVTYVDVYGQKQTLDMPSNSLFFTYCQVPVVYTLSDEKFLAIKYANGTDATFSTDTLTKADSELLFNRGGSLHSIKVGIQQNQLM